MAKCSTAFNPVKFSNFQKIRQQFWFNINVTHQSHTTLYIIYPLYQTINAIYLSEDKNGSEIG